MTLALTIAAAWLAASLLAAVPIGRAIAGGHHATTRCAAWDGDAA